MACLPHQNGTSPGQGLCWVCTLLGPQSLAKRRYPVQVSPACKGEGEGWKKEEPQGWVEHTCFYLLSWPSRMRLGAVPVRVAVPPMLAE